MIRAVLDTNVLAAGIAGLFSPTSLPGRIFRLWLRDAFALVTSEHILAELTRTLDKPYFRARVDPVRRRRTEARIRRRATVADIVNPLYGVASHTQDDAVVATAVDGQADYLVTGDADLLRLGQYGSVRIVTPRAFLQELGVDPEEEGRE